MSSTDQLTHLQPLCALLMLRMTHVQLLKTISAGHHRRRPVRDDEPAGECPDMLASLDFAALREGAGTIAGARRLAQHIGACEMCMMRFVLWLDDVRRQKPTTQGDSMSDVDGSTQVDQTLVSLTEVAKRYTLLHGY